VNSPRFHMAHPRLCSAHCPEPLTAPGAAQACPSCLPVPFNQLISDGDLRPDRPLKNGVRSASGHSPIGGFIFDRPTFSLNPVRNLVPVARNCGHCSGRRALRFLGPSAIADAANQRSFPERSDSIRPFSPSSLSPRPLLRTQRTGASICIDLSAGVLGNEFRDSSNTPAQQIGLSHLRGHFPGPNDRQDSTFSRKKCGRLADAHFSAAPSRVRHASEGVPFFQPNNTTNPYL